MLLSGLEWSMWWWWLLLLLLLLGSLARLLYGGSGWWGRNTLLLLLLRRLLLLDLLPQFHSQVWGQVLDTVVPGIHRVVLVDVPIGHLWDVPILIVHSARGHPILKAVLGPHVREAPD